jgi:hypothetical protein
MSRGNKVPARKIINLFISAIIGPGVIISCAQQLPNTAANQQGNSIVQSAALSLSEMTELKDLKISYQDDETSIRDSEVIAGTANNFSVKKSGNGNSGKGSAKNSGKGSTGKGKSSGKQNDDNTAEVPDVESPSPVNATPSPGVSPEPGHNTGKSIEKLLKKAEKGQSLLKFPGTKPEPIKELLNDQVGKLKRKDVSVHTSDEIAAVNEDGTTSKLMVIKFQNKNDSNTRENKIIKTLGAGGELIKLEHYLTVTLNQYSRTYTKIIEYNADGSQTISITSETKWPNGKVRTVTEERTINADGSGTGTATVKVTTPDGQTVTYQVTITISSSGDIDVVPEPAPSPSASSSAEPTPAESPSDSASPVESASPDPSVSPSVEPTSEPTVEPSLEPTAEPTVEPTSEPTVDPVPSESPIASTDPSSAPL